MSDNEFSADPDPQDEGNENADPNTEPSAGRGGEVEEIPSLAAHVGFKIEKIGGNLGITVPGENAEQLLEVTSKTVPVLGSTLGPIGVLWVCADIKMPWEAVFALALIAALAPLVFYMVTHKGNGR
ncbi:hypothetical protein [Streptomyces fuscigenes]|uniref:hypothetical protein n=1 Tax=Streptomyces fuscigenes TaxID=1528880 RepID=UPI001F4174FD|nr:hypothetical protein [Streptomyces fuscigenes]MCF3961544.1 hypothetical protein [Streptomyces fuscigenes]